MRVFPVTLSLCLAAAAFSSPLIAGQADICYSPDESLGSLSAPDITTVFSCPQAGDKTLPELAADGWQVVQLMPVTTSGSTGANQLVIQKP